MMRYFEIEKKILGWEKEPSYVVAMNIEYLCADFVPFIEFVKKSSPFERSEHITRFLTLVLFIHETNFDNEIINHSIEKVRESLSEMVCFIYLNQETILNIVVNMAAIEPLIKKGGPIQSSSPDIEHLSRASFFEDSAFGKIGDEVILPSDDYKKITEEINNLKIKKT